MSRVITFSGVYFTKNANSLERITEDSKQTFNKLWLWPCKAIDDATKKRTPNTDSVFVGEKCDGPDCTPDELTFDSQPYLIELPPGDTKFLKDVMIQANVQGEGVFFKGWI